MDGVDGGLPQAGLFPVRTLSNFWEGGGLQAEPQGRFKGFLLACVCIYFLDQGAAPPGPPLLDGENFSFLVQIHNMASPHMRNFS